MIEIRNATLSDVHTIYQFLCLLEEKQLNKAQFDKCYAYNVQSPHNHYLLAEEDGRAVGFLSCHGQLLLHHTGWVYEIQELYVSDSHRGRGIGKLLLHEIERILAGTEYDVLEVSSSVRRKEAHRFYGQNGFEQSHLKFTRKGNQDW